MANIQMLMKEHFGLYLILTDPIAGYKNCAQAAVDCEIRYLQLRMKNAESESFLTTACLLREITRNTATNLIINDHLDVAIQSDADGVHLGQSDMSIGEARRTWNLENKIFGLSTHSKKQAEEAFKTAPNYIGIGPVFPSGTKADTAPVLGPTVAGSIAQDISHTSVAIGGINTTNLSSVLKAGFKNYCVVRAVNSSPNPAHAIQALQEIWKNHTF